MPAPSFKKRLITLTRTGTGSVIGTVGTGGWRYFKCNTFRAQVTSSGTTGQIELKDGNGDIFYKDAADKDYQTAEITRVFGIDDTATGLGISATDATGAAVAAAEGFVKDPILEGPITVTWADADGSAGTLRVELMIEV